MNYSGQPPGVASSGPKQKSQKSKYHCSFDFIAQHVSIFNVDLLRKSYSGVSILKFRTCNTQPDKHLFCQLDVNCAKQLKLSKITVNNVDVKDFTHSYSRGSLLYLRSFVLSSVQKNKEETYYPCSLASLNPLVDELLSKDSQRGKSELRITVPEEIQKKIISNPKTELTVQVEFHCQEPKSGFYFFDSPNRSNQENHMYTCTNGLPGSARLCFPCVDTYAALATWKFELTCYSDQVAIASGQLTNTVENANGTKVFVYELDVPTVAASIGIAIGHFSVIKDQHSSISHLCPTPLHDNMLATTKYTPNDAFEFYENLLNQKYPYKHYRQVFVFDGYDDAVGFAGVSIIDARFMHSKLIIEQVNETRILSAHMLAKQYFGRYLQRSVKINNIYLINHFLRREIEYLKIDNRNAFVIVKQFFDVKI